MELSASEILILTMGLRSLMEQELHPKDREIAEVLDRKLRISYKGRKVRIILTNE